MLVKQIHQLVNSITSEVLGKQDLLKEDLSNVIDVGNEIFGSDKVDSYVKKLVNKVGKTIFVDRLYKGGYPSLLMDSWEFGSVLEKISAELPEAHESDSWDLTNGNDYSPNVFHEPKIQAKFYNSKVCFEIPMSFTEMQVKQSFNSAEQLNGFISMIQTAVENSMTVKIDSLISRTVNNMIAETALSDLLEEGSLNFEKSTVKCVNLLKLFEVKNGKSLPVNEALYDKDFIRFAAYQMGMYVDRLSKISTLFNVGGKERFTPSDKLNTILLSDFSKVAETFLISETFNPEKVALPKHDSVPYWQGSGTNYNFEDVSSIDVKTNSGDVKMSGIIGIMSDKDACAVTNLDRRVTTNYNPKAEFYNNFYKFDAGFYNDLNENFVVFYMA